jgi:hypothetical protein
MLWRVVLIWWLLASCIQGVHAAPPSASFPDIKFRHFADFVDRYLHANVSLSVALAFLFTVIRNPQLLSLHQRSQITPNRRDIKSNRWLKAMAQQMVAVWDRDDQPLLRTYSSNKTETTITAIEALLRALYLEQDDNGNYLEIDETACDNLLFLTPNRTSCRNPICRTGGQVPPVLRRGSRNRDIPLVTVIKGTKVHKNALILAAECPACDALYYPDHSSHLLPGSTERERYYVKTAPFIKAGTNLWVDPVFCDSVLNAHYSYSSTASFVEHWNNSYGAGSQTGSTFKLTRRHVFEAFTQYSIRQIAHQFDDAFKTTDKVDIKNLVILANQHLVRRHDPQPTGQVMMYGGRVPIGFEHQCEECVHPYINPPATPIPFTDPAATMSRDVHGSRPPQLAENAQDIDVDLDPADRAHRPATNQTFRMHVIDGIVMGPLHCALEGCIQPLIDSTKGVWCAQHIERARLCHVVGCTRPRDSTRDRKSLVCNDEGHQAMWARHCNRFGNQSMLRMRREIRRTQNEENPWNHNPQSRPAAPEHDADGEPVTAARQHYFYPSRMYCVEVMVTPDGVPVGWALCPRSESPTQIIQFIEMIHPNPEDKSQNYCCDKGCQILRRLVTLGKWDEWKQTTRISVDSFHFINHRATDVLCRTWCNPEPLDGSAPNLVKTEVVNGRTVHTRCFNTQVNEQYSDDMATEPHFRQVNS